MPDGSELWKIGNVNMKNTNECCAASTKDTNGGSEN